MHVVSACRWAADRLAQAQRREAEISVQLALAATCVDETRAPLIHWRRDLRAALRALGSPLGQLLDANDATAPAQLRRVAAAAEAEAAAEEAARCGAEGRAAAAAMREAEATIAPASAAAGRSGEAVRCALVEAVGLHARHVAAVAALSGAPEGMGGYPDGLGFAGGEFGAAEGILAEAIRAVPPAPTLAPTLRALVAAGDAAGSAGSAGAASALGQAAAALPRLDELERAALASEAALVRSAADVWRALDEYVARTRGRLPSHASVSLCASWETWLGLALGASPAACSELLQQALSGGGPAVNPEAVGGPEESLELALLVATLRRAEGAASEAHAALSSTARRHAAALDSFWAWLGAALRTGGAGIRQKQRPKGGIPEGGPIPEHRDTTIMGHRVRGHTYIRRSPGFGSVAL